MATIIKKSNILSLIKDLQKKYDVYTPVKKGDVSEPGGFRHMSEAKPLPHFYLFEGIKNKEKIELDYTTTILSPKNIFFPTTHILMNFSENNPKLRFGASTPLVSNKVKIPKFNKRILIFGIHPYDVRALLILDGIFMENGIDPYYYERRKNSVIVAVNNKNTPNYFYNEFDYDYSKGIDLFLEDSGNIYVATAKTKFGREILNSKFFESSKKITSTDIPKKSKNKLLNLKGIKSSIEKGANEKIWAEVAEKCLGCGICSYVCPICHCFDIEDRINLDGFTGFRCRKHDSCMLYEFSLILGKINFRERLQDRIYNWYHHKFVRAPNERGVVDCVGCGRCITFCPAEIDIKGVLDRLQYGTE